MGLMMSVLVFTVGVLEALSCLEHIRDSYLPFDHVRRRRKMVVDVNTGSVKHVDIPWPGDVPKGQHVIKKRSGYMSVQNSLEEDIVPPPMIDPDELNHALSAALFEEDTEESEELNQIFSGVQSSPIHSTQIATYSNELFIPIQESSSECEDMFDSLTDFENSKLNKKKKVTFDLNKIVFDISVDASETEEEKEDLSGPVASSRIKHEFEKSSHSKQKSEPNIPAKKTEEEKVSTVKTIAVSRLISHDSSPSENKILITDTEECSSEDEVKGSSSDSSINTSAASLLVSFESSVDETKPSDESDSTSDSTGPTTIENKSQDLTQIDLSTESDLQEENKSLICIATKQNFSQTAESQVSKSAETSKPIESHKTENESSNARIETKQTVIEDSSETHVSKPPVMSETSEGTQNIPASLKKDEKSLKDCLTLDIVEKPEIEILNSETIKAPKDDKLYETEIESRLDRNESEETREKDKILIKEVKDLKTKHEVNEFKENGVKENVKKEGKTSPNVLQDITDLNNVQRFTNETKIIEIELIRNVSKNATEGSEPVSHQVLSVSPSLEEGDVVSLKPSEKTEQELVPVEEVSSNSPEKAFWLIFSGEYTKAMSKDWHSGHFCCWQCDESLTGQRYVLRDDHPYCIKCYESVFANTCDECNKTIGIDSKDLSYKDKHWHEACFFCNKCRVSLVDKQFGSKADKIYCGNCYDAQFASRCDGCGQIFRAGTKKMEYKTRQWHEQCFCCCVCKSAIGTKSFIPREQEIYCATCYEEKFATRCVKCNKIITSGGVTYKNEPWHRECFTCTNCSTSLAGQRFTSRDEKPYCADCFGELFAKRCTACCKPITGIGGTRFISFEDRHWHNDCFICASCKSSLVGRGFITDAEDILCTECAKQKLM